MPQPVHHHLRRMVGRDPQESGRAATSLELLYDLTLVVAFAVSGAQAAQTLASGHQLAATLGFAFSCLAASWAWVNFAWFASAFDTDDWLVRLCVLLQMVGVVVMALGMPDFYAGLVDGWRFDNRVMVLGYVLMRVGMGVLWGRVAATDPEHRKTAMLYLKTLVVAQSGWVFLALAPLSLPWALAASVPVYALELGGPFLAERRQRTPWNPDHIADRYGCLTIVVLGEVVVGTQGSLQALVATHGWNVDVVVLGLAGLGGAMAMWWTYFNVPWGEMLDVIPRGVFPWAYGHLVLFAAIAATGAGFQVGARAMQGEAAISAWQVVAASSAPVGLFTAASYGLWLVFDHHGMDTHHVVAVVVTLAMLVASVLLAAAGVSLWLCLLPAMAAPWATVVGYEVFGYRNFLAC